MAHGRVGTLDEQENPEEMIEMNTFKSNIETEREAEVDSFHDRMGILKIVCVGDYSGRWGKRVYIDDYISSDETIREKPNNKTVIGVDFALKLLHDKSGKRIPVQIWIIGEQERFTAMTRVHYKNACGVLVFWGARSCSMDSALKWKHNISQFVGRDVPCVLIVDNVFNTPAEWVGEGLVMNSLEEMNSFCLEHGFFSWFEMQERAGGEKSVFGQAMRSLINEIISRNKKF